MSKDKKYICGSCKAEVTHDQKYCGNCGTELKKATDSASISDAKYIYEEGDTVTFIDHKSKGDKEYTGEVVKAYKSGADPVYDIKVGSKVYKGVPEEMMGYVDSTQLDEFTMEGVTSDTLDQGISDSIAGNKKADYVIKTLISSGLRHSQAVALLAYHGSMQNIRKAGSTKTLLKYKYLKRVITDTEAQMVIDYLSKKKLVTV